MPVGRSIGWSVSIGKSMKNGPSRIVNDLDSAGRGRKRDEEEGDTGRKEVRKGTRNGEVGGTRRVKK